MKDRRQRCTTIVDVFVREQDGVPKARLLLFILSTFQQSAILTPLRDRYVLAAMKHVIIHKKAQFVAHPMGAMNGSACARHAATAR